jgi:hypothetical protein
MKSHPSHGTSSPEDGGDAAGAWQLSASAPARSPWPTAAYYPQSNGKIECWHATLTSEHFRVKSPQNLEEARKVVDDFVTYDNEVRLHSGLGYITPRDILAGPEKEICDTRDRKLEASGAKRLGARSRSLAETAQQAVLI